MINLLGKNFFPVNVMVRTFSSFIKNTQTIKTEALMLGTLDTYRKYYEDTHLYSLDSKVVSVGEENDEKYVVFDQTIFHPQGGGQPDDKGSFTINGNEYLVTKLVAPKDPYASPYTIKHFYSDEDSVSVEAGMQAVQKIDENSRLLFARLHSAGHLLAYAAEEIYPDLKAIVGNHFPKTSFVLFKGTSLPNKEEFKSKVSELVNKLTLQDLSVTNNWNVSPRTVQFGELAAHGCGGTHVKSSAEIGLFIIRSIKTEKGNLKVGYDVKL